jgi:hypothetical protein
VSETASILLQDAADALRNRIAGASELSASDRAFLAWALQAENPGEKLLVLAAAAATEFPTTRSYHHVATLGYGAHAGLLDGDQSRVLQESLTWLCGRSAEIVDDPAPFVTDSVALLGVALGARSVGGQVASSTLQWLLAFVPGAAKLPAVENWQRCLFSVALSTLGSTAIALPTDQGVADVRTALRARSITPSVTDETAAVADDRLTLSLLKDEDAEHLPIVRAALRVLAYSWIRRAAPVVVPGRATVRDVVSLLERVPAGLRRWAWEDKSRTGKGEARKWHVDHEYHVQDLLYFLLAPIFPDIKDEEYFPSIGQKQPRTDLFIPSLKLIVEVKFLRQGDKVTKIIDEVGSDASLYLAEGSEYEGIVAFVWDDSRRSEEHPLLRDGLRKIRGIVDAVIISRPGEMV